MAVFNSVISLFEEQVINSPNATAIVFENDSLSYSELNQKVNSIVASLKEKSVSKNTIVGIFLERSFDLIAAIIGTLKIGATYLPIDLNLPANRINKIISDSRINSLIASDKTLDKLQFLKTNFQIINITSINKILHTGCLANPELHISEADLAYVIYTSGSTGVPKGVSMPHRSAANLIQWQIKQSKIDSIYLRVLQFAPISFDVSFQEIFSTLCSGGTLIIISDEKRKSSASIINCIIDNKITRVYLPFVVLNQVADITSNDLLPSSLREIISSGEQLIITPSIFKLFQLLPDCSLQNQYGPTESHVVSYYTLSKDVNSWPKLPPIGKPIENVQIYLLDPSLQKVSKSTEGEIYLGGDCLASGYLHKIDLTEQKFISNPFGKGRLYKTGDFGRINDSGELEFIGRIDEQVKVRGYRVELGEIEAVLNNSPIVDQGVVVTKKSKYYSNKIFAYVILKKNTKDNNYFSELMKYLSEQLPDYMLPSNIFFVPSFPISPNGKIDRTQLPELIKNRPSINVPIVYPSSNIEESISDVWKDVLQLNLVGIDDNFFDLGGNSLLLTIMHTMLMNNLNYMLPITLLFEKPTIRLLAKFLESPTINNEKIESNKTFSQPNMQINRKNIRQSITENLNKRK